PGTVSVALLPIEIGPCSTWFVAVTTMVKVSTGDRMEVLVEVMEVFSVPRLQVTEPLLAVPQVPRLAAAETKVEFPPILSVNTAPVTGSPVLKIKYLKVTWLPTPTGVGVTDGLLAPGGLAFAGVSCGILRPDRFGPTLLTNASGRLGEVGCSALAVVGKLGEAV